MTNLSYILYGLTFLLITSCGSKRVMTVNGMTKLKKGIILSHEHMVTDFRGKEIAEQNTYNLDDAFETIIPHLRQLKQRGVNTIFECTPEYIGRDVALLKKLSDSSGINILTNTGFYAAVNKKYLPSNISKMTVDELYAIWELEWLEGIQNSGIRPGFIKLGVGNGKLDSIEEKLLTAAIRLSKKSNLTIAIHTGDGEAALSEYQIAKKLDFRPEKIIWVHAQNGTNQERVKMAQKGVWVSLDGIGEDNISEYINMIAYMKSNNVLNKLLISQDDGWSVNEGPNREINLEPFKEGYQPFQAINNLLLPALEKAHFTKAEINLLLYINPKNAYSLD